MATVTFDTYKFVSRLKSSGMPEEYANAISEGLKEAQGEMELVTKKDMDIATNNLTHEIKELENRMIIKMGTMLVVAIGILTAVIKLVK